MSTGQVHWSILGGSDYRGLIGRVEQVDVEHGVSSTYACPMPTADNYYDAWIFPGYEYEGAGNWVKFTAMEQDIDAYTHEVGSPYDISDILYWFSYQTGVAWSGGDGWFYAQSGGWANIGASGESNGWEDYQGGEGGNHVPISVYADLEVQRRCNDQRDNMIEEYRAGQVALNPTCDDFSNGGGSQHFTWNELNGGFSNGNPHNPWGIVRSALTDGLEATRSNYNRGGIRLTSGYRCPHGNANVGGHWQSLHMHGRAADMYSNDHPWTEQEFNLLRIAAAQTGPSELLHWNSYTDRHLHAAW